MLQYVRDGDTVRIKSPDRLARSTTDLLDLIGTMRKKGVAIEFVDNPTLNTDSPQGAFMLTILGAVAQLERATIRERQAEGIALAKDRGVYDRAPKLTEEQISAARERIAGAVPKAVVARDLNVSRATLYAALAGSGRYARA
jgi:DNA invertase Pin-like site-specific DNA recombinase